MAANKSRKLAGFDDPGTPFPFVSIRMHRWIIPFLDQRAPRDQPWRPVIHQRSIIIPEQPLDPQPITLEDQAEFPMKQPGHLKAVFLAMLAPPVVKPGVMKRDILNLAVKVPPDLGGLIHGSIQRGNIKQMRIKSTGLIATQQ